MLLLLPFGSFFLQPPWSPGPWTCLAGLISPGCLLSTHGAAKHAWKQQLDLDADATTDLNWATLLFVYQLPFLFPSVAILKLHCSPLPLYQNPASFCSKDTTRSALYKAERKRFCSGQSRNFMTDSGDS